MLARRSASANVLNENRSPYLDTNPDYDPQNPHKRKQTKNMRFQTKSNEIEKKHLLFFSVKERTKDE